jgi:hypothetical protein
VFFEDAMISFAERVLEVRQTISRSQTITLNLLKNRGFMTFNPLSWFLKSPSEVPNSNGNNNNVNNNNNNASNGTNTIETTNQTGTQILNTQNSTLTIPREIDAYFGEKIQQALDKQEQKHSKEIEDLQVKISKIHDECIQNKILLEKSQEAYEKSQEELAYKNQENSLLKQEKECLEEKFNELKTQFDNQIVFTNESMKKAQNAHQLQLEKNKLIKDLEEMRKDMNMIANSCAENKTQIEGLVKDKLKLESENNELDKSLKALENKQEKVLEEYKQIIKKNDELKEARKLDKQEIEMLKKKLDDSIKENNELRKQLKNQGISINQKSGKSDNTPKEGFFPKTSSFVFVRNPYALPTRFITTEPKKKSNTQGNDVKN